MIDELVVEQKVIVFELKGKAYAIRIDQVGSIESMEAITRVPQTADFVRGVINLRGVVTPIIDLSTRVGFAKSKQSESTRIIIVHLEGVEAGLIVDAANDVIDIPTEAIASPPKVAGAIDTDYIEGVVRYDDRLLTLLNLEKILDAEPVEKIFHVEE